MEQSEEHIPFQADDDDKFIAYVTGYLKDGADRVRGLSATEYVEKCRGLWRACETDEVFKVRILIDKLVLDQTRDGLWPPPGFQKVQDAEEPAEDLYCDALGLIFPDGTYVDAPAGYVPGPVKPGSRRVVALALPTKIPVEEAAEPEPAKYVLALFDVLGFSKRLEGIGLARMHELYKSLIGVALEPYTAKNQWTRMMARMSANTYFPGIFWLPIRYAYFSDSLLLWLPYQPEFVQPFFDRVLNMFCEALRLELPLRGAVTAGTAILHKKSNTFLGDPLVEAAKLHDAQQWIGAACGVSVRSEVMHIPFSPHQVMLFDAPVKEKRHEALLSGLVLDWPRRWRELHGVSPDKAVSGLRSPGFEIYYDTALAFIQYSQEHSEWFMEGLPDKSGEDA